jgi:hypothetical protein
MHQIFTAMSNRWCIFFLCHSLYMKSFVPKHTANLTAVRFLFIYKISPVSIGFAFIYMEDEQDAEDAIRGLDSTEFGTQRRRLSVEWTKVVFYIYIFHIFALLLLLYRLKVDISMRVLIDYVFRYKN